MSCSDYLFFFENSPFVVQRELMEVTNPLDLFHVSMTSSANFQLVKWMNIRMEINVTVTNDYVTINSKNASNFQSDIHFGKMPHVNGDVFTCSFDQVTLRNCIKMHNGAVYRYGLRVVLHRLLSLFPRATVGNVHIALRPKAKNGDFRSALNVLQVVKSSGRDIRMISFEDGEYSLETMEPFGRMFQLFPNSLNLPLSIIVERGEGFPIGQYLGLQYFRIDNTSMGDGDFIDMVNAWRDSKETQFCTCFIGTTKWPEDVEIAGAQPDTTYFEGTVQRADGSKATFIRKRNAFYFIVDEQV